MPHNGKSIYIRKSTIEQISNDFLLIVRRDGTLVG